MKISEFRRACNAEFGEQYAAVVVRDHWLREVGATAEEAITSGVEPRRVWNALCDELQIPLSRRHGRGLRDLPKD